MKYDSNKTLSENKFHIIKEDGSLGGKKCKKLKEKIKLEITYDNVEIGKPRAKNGTSRFGNYMKFIFR